MNRFIHHHHKLIGHGESEHAPERSCRYDRLLGIADGSKRAVLLCVLAASAASAQDVSPTRPLIGDFDRYLYGPSFNYRHLVPYAPKIGIPQKDQSQAKPVLQVRAKIITDALRNSQHHLKIMGAISKVRRTLPAVAVGTDFLQDFIASFDREAIAQEQKYRPLEAALSRCASANCLYYSGNWNKAQSMYDEALSLIKQPGKVDDETRKTLLSLIENNKYLCERASSTVKHQGDHGGGSNTRLWITKWMFHDSHESGASEAGTIAWIYDLDEIEYSATIELKRIPQTPTYNVDSPSAWDFPN